MSENPVKNRGGGLNSLIDPGGPSKKPLFLLVFIASAFIYFYDVFLRGLILALDDGLHYFYPMFSAVADQYRDGTLPLWLSHEFSGFPLMAASQTGVFYPFIFLYIVLPAHIAYNMDVMLHIALAGYFTFLYARKIGADTFAAFVSGLMFAFLGYLVPHIAHMSVLRTAAWLPLIFFCIENMRQTGRPRCALVAALAMAMQIFAGHAQVYFYSFMAVGLYVLYHSIYMHGAQRFKFIGLSAAGLLLALAVASPQIVATEELYEHGVRPMMDYENFADYSLPAKGLAGAFFPHVGDNDLYLGALTLMIALAVVIRERRNRHVLFWGLLAVVALLLSLGDTLRPLHKIMFHVPLYNKFRVPSKHLIEYGLSVSILASLGISCAVRNWESYRRTLLIIISAVVIVSATSSALTGAISQKAVYVPLILMSFCGAVIFIAKGKKELLRYLVIAVLVFDIFSLKMSPWPDSKGASNYGEGVFDALDKSEGRTAFFIRGIGALMAASKGIDIVDGYDPLVTSDYASLLDMGYLGSISYEKKTLLANNAILSMLNTRYIFLLPDEVDYVKGRPEYSKVLEAPDISIYENTKRLPRAYCVLVLESAENIREVKEKLYNLDIDPVREALVSARDLNEIGGRIFHPGTVMIKDYGHMKVTIEAFFDGGRGFLVLADQYYPGWNAYIDGNPAKIYQTNGVLRGVVVPPGAHEITFVYFPLMIYIFMALGGVTLVAMLAAIALDIRRGS